MSARTREVLHAARMASAMEAEAAVSTRMERRALGLNAVETMSTVTLPV